MRSCGRDALHVSEKGCSEISASGTGDRATCISSATASAPGKMRCASIWRLHNRHPLCQDADNAQQMEVTMAYVRRKGNQVVIVHGHRDSTTGKVQQQTLFVLYSKDEAQAAVGESQQWFRQMLESEHPQIRFNWKKLDAGIKDLLDGLPDTSSCKMDRIDGCFRSALVDFTRELLVADPQDFIASAHLLGEQRHELEYVRKLIDWRLRLSDQQENEWNRDNPFYWKALMNRRSVPPEAGENLGTLYANTEYEKVDALAGLLTECWSNYADGYSYRGLAAVEREDMDAARNWYQKAMEVGRGLFPKRIRKDSYWADLSTRPYIRAIIYLAEVCNMMGDYDEGLAFCDRLENECHQDVDGALGRVPIYLNTGLWNEAARAARYVHKIFPKQNIPLAFALHEMGRGHKALVHFLTGAIQFPRTARMLCGLPRGSAPKSSREVDDHNAGVTHVRELHAYLRDRKNRAPLFFKGILKDARVIACIDEAAEVRRRWEADRSGDRKWFDRMKEMHSAQFAEEQAEGLW